MLHFFATYERLSRIYSLDGAGIAVGALMGGASLTCYRGNAEPLFAVAMVMMSSFPCSLSVMFFALTTFIAGIAKGLMFVSEYIVVIVCVSIARRVSYNLI